MARDTRDIMRKRYVDVLECNEAQAAEFERIMRGVYVAAGIATGPELAERVCGQRDNSTFKRAYSHPQRMSFKTLNLICNALGVDDYSEIESRVLGYDHKWTIAEEANTALRRVRVLSRRLVCPRGSRT